MPRRFYARIALPQEPYCKTIFLCLSMLLSNYANLQNRERKIRCGVKSQRKERCPNCCRLSLSDDNEQPSQLAVRGKALSLGTTLRSIAKTPRASPRTQAVNLQRRIWSNWFPFLSSQRTLQVSLQRPVESFILPAREENEMRTLLQFFRTDICQ